MALSKKDDWGRRLRSFFSNFWFVSQGVVLTYAATRLWLHYVWPSGRQFNKEDENIVIGVGITFQSVIYGIFAALVMSIIWENFKNVVAAVIKKDWDTFMRYRDERPPLRFHVALSCFSLVLLYQIALLPYHAASSGVVIFGGFFFIMVLYWMMATQLSNPIKSPWVKERVPKRLWKMNVDEYFKEGVKELAPKNTSEQSPAK